MLVFNIFLLRGIAAWGIRFEASPLAGEHCHWIDASTDPATICQSIIDSEIAIGQSSVVASFGVADEETKCFVLADRSKIETDNIGIYCARGVIQEVLGFVVVGVECSVVCVVIHGDYL